MGALSPAEWCERLERAAATARSGDDVEGVHQVRVAARRLRALLELGGRRVLVDDLRWLTRALSRARDLDVLREALPATDERFHAWRARLARSARAACVAALTSPRFEGLMAALRAAPPVDPSVARRGLEALRRRARAQLAVLKAADSAGQAAALHALRRALRRWRYALEWLGEDSRELSQLQGALGAVCDVAALARLVREYAVSSGADVTEALARLTAAQRAMTGQVLIALDAAR